MSLRMKCWKGLMEAIMVWFSDKAHFHFFNLSISKIDKFGELKTLICVFQNHSVLKNDCVGNCFQ